ncbi:MAG: hypothetical protein DME69_12520 [Verrucomicrobia bacterium]|nr:MAG: hypothetical protein DME69_12520 [Verrucomicrobiota bacterium]
MPRLTFRNADFGAPPNGARADLENRSAVAAEPVKLSDTASSKLERLLCTLSVHRLINARD